ncbi:MAG TPA: hypothetical protein VF883_20025 [Thermoanaerobaculia bacterium]|jgi:hypothetical protein
MKRSPRTGRGGSIGTPSLFQVEDRRSPARKLKLMSIERRPGDIFWVRCKVRRDAR